MSPANPPAFLAVARLVVLSFCIVVLKHLYCVPGCLGFNECVSCNMPNPEFNLFVTNLWETYLRCNDIHGKQWEFSELSTEGQPWVEKIWKWAKVITSNNCGRVSTDHTTIWCCIVVTFPALTCCWYHSLFTKAVIMILDKKRKIYQCIQGTLESRRQAQQSAKSHQVSTLGWKKLPLASPWILKLVNNPFNC